MTGRGPVDITLRPVADEDRSFLSRLYASTREDELSVVDWTDQQKASFLEMQFDAQTKHWDEHFPEAQRSLICLDERPAGRLYVDRREDEIRIVDIALLPEHRGRGIGGHLLRELLKEGRRTCRPVRIHVEQFNPALRLYERLGFSKIGETGVYLLMERRPAVPAT